VVSASGTFLQQTAIGWLVLERTGSPSDLGLVLAAGGIPSLLLGPWGGAVADRVDLRKLLVVTQTLYCLLAALLWGLAAAGEARVAALVAIGVVGGVSSRSPTRPPVRPLSAAWYRRTTWPAQSASTGWWSTAPGSSAPPWRACSS
jgi:MFS family permease